MKMNKIHPLETISHLVGTEDTPESGTCSSCGKDLTRVELKIGDQTVYHLPTMCDECIKASRSSSYEEKRGIRELGIRPRFQDKTFESFEQDGFNEQAYKVCKRFSEIFPETGGKGLYLYGGTGTGKTHLGISLLRDVGDGFIINAAELMDEISYRNSDVMRRCIDTPLLILDDVGAEQMSRDASLFVRNRFYRIINERYEFNRPTIITTNIVPEELKQNLGERIASRMSEMCVPIRVAGRDRRVRK